MRLQRVTICRQRMVAGALTGAAVAGVVRVGLQISGMKYMRGAGFVWHVAPPA